MKMGLLDSLKGMFGGGGDDDAIPVEETITEPAEPVGESEPAPEPTPEPAAEETSEPEPAVDEPTGSAEANMDAKTCGSCGADFGTCEHTSQSAMA